MDDDSKVLIAVFCMIAVVVVGGAFAAAWTDHSKHSCVIEAAKAHYSVEQTQELCK